MTQYSQPPILTEEFDPDKAEPSLTVEGDVVLKVFNKEFSYPLIITLMAENILGVRRACQRWRWRNREGGSRSPRPLGDGRSQDERGGRQRKCLLSPGDHSDKYGALVDNLYLFLIFLCFARLARTLTSPSWSSALTPWTRCSMTRTTIRNYYTVGVADDSFKSTNSPTNSDLIRCFPFLGILWISKERPVSKQPFRSKLCCPCPSSFFNALFSHRAACRMLTMPGNKFSTRSPECIDSVSRPV